MIDYPCHASASTLFHFNKPKIISFPQKRLVLGDGLAGKWLPAAVCRLAGLVFIVTTSSHSRQFQTSWIKLSDERHMLPEHSDTFFEGEFEPKKLWFCIKSCTIWNCVVLKGNLLYMVCTTQLQNSPCSEEVCTHWLALWTAYLMFYTAYILQMQFNMARVKYLFCWGHWRNI